MRRKVNAETEKERKRTLKGKRLRRSRWRKTKIASKEGKRWQRVREVVKGERKGSERGRGERKWGERKWEEREWGERERGEKEREGRERAESE